MVRAYCLIIHIYLPNACFILIASTPPLARTATVSEVVTMDSMFNSAGSFNRDLSKWSVAKVTSTARMFRSAIAFNGNVFTWEPSNLTDAELMFSGASSFDQDLCWALPDVAATTNMLSGTTASLLESCVKCAPGSYRADPYTCAACPPGVFSTTHNQSACAHVCPVGR